MPEKIVVPPPMGFLFPGGISRSGTLEVQAGHLYARVEGAAYALDPEEHEFWYIAARDGSPILKGLPPEPEEEVSSPAHTENMLQNEDALRTLIAQEVTKALYSDPTLQEQLRDLQVAYEVGKLEMQRLLALCKDYANIAHETLKFAQSHHLHQEMARLDMRRREFE